MTLEQMCCTREQSKRLRELGIDQKSYFYHTIVHVTHLPYVPIGETWDKDLIGSAYTVAELGIMLPHNFTSCALDPKRTTKTEIVGNWWVYESDFSDECETCSEPGSLTRRELARDTEAQARAAILIYLIENERLSVEEVNKRLHE